MRRSFYPKLAMDGIHKNKRLYLPYLLTCMGMVIVYYIITSLHCSNAIKYLPGSDALYSMLRMGSDIIAIFAVIFLFYTNSFLIRRRKKEFGLYNILGMNKRNISRILFWESLIIAGISLGGGLVGGIALSKIAELGLVNIVKGEVKYSVNVSPKAISMTVVIFGIIFFLLFLNGIRQIKFSNAIALMKSENVGEKPPKGNWFFGLLGVILLGGAYYITVSIKDPIAALIWFFIAVIMVIIGTYLLFVAGSVLFCRILQKKKKYYYKANHFVSVSSMIYRMKRNGAGLASICILATMVLVMISSTTNLYFGSEDSLNSRYPKHINIELHMNQPEDLESDAITKVRELITKKVKESNAETTELKEYRDVSFTSLLDGSVLHLDESTINNFNMTSVGNLCQVHVIGLLEYNKMMGTNETLKADEALMYSYRSDYKETTIGLEGGKNYKIKKQLTDFVGSGDAAMNIIPSLFIVVNDTSDILDGVRDIVNDNGMKLVNSHWLYEFDTNLDSDGQVALAKSIRAALDKVSEDKAYHMDTAICESREANRIDFYGTFGSLFFLGIILSIVFIFAAVLIIYYKQISEGYEDQARFEIMQKVGMTKKEIRKSINSQLLTVFFLPLISAGVHLAFAFPIIQKLLLLFNLTNVALFALTTLISFLVFALFYTMIYRVTSNAYYNIVSGVKE